MTYVFNIQRYSLHDGEGIRTTVFLKGCPLHCRWCCNPESQNREKEIMYLRGKCIGESECGYCGKYGFGFSEGKADITASLCPSEAVDICPSKAIKTVGEEYTAEEILDIAERDSVFYGNDGGITISGGEPLIHKNFILSILKKARERHIKTSIETCGYADYDTLFAAAGYLDMIMFDIKSLDEKKHIEFTGKSNKKIIENFKRLCIDHPELKKKVRTPVIPEFNDNEKDISEIAGFLRNKPNIKYELLPYHSYGKSKYISLGRIYPMG
ncbi:MAG: glycyl-radical enzyme activating protein, partial [Firmicutes bacterium]|nr:glycyl-radical enzyme activating protein [Bacillota bacterium]